MIMARDHERTARTQGPYSTARAVRSYRYGASSQSCCHAVIRIECTPQQRLQCFSVGRMTQKWLHHVGIFTPSNICYLGSTRFRPQTASRSGQPFLQGSLTCPTDKQTHRPRYSVCSNRTHLTIAAKRPNLSIYTYKNTSFLFSVLPFMVNKDEYTSVTQVWPERGCLLCCMAPMPSARFGMIGTNSSVPRHYPGTLSPAGSQRSQHNVGVSLRRTRLCDLKPKTIGGEREGGRVSAIPCCGCSSYNNNNNNNNNGKLAPYGTGGRLLRVLTAKFKVT